MTPRVATMPTLTAVILAGGRGERLGKICRDLPKPLVPVAGIPILDRQIAALTAVGVRKVFILAGHLGGQIEEHVAGRHEVEIRCLVESPLQGTAGALAQLAGRLESDFFFIFGDVFFDMDLAALAADHLRHAALLTLVVHPTDHPGDSDLVEVDDAGRLLAIIGREGRNGWHTNLGNTGIAMASPRLLSFLLSGESADFTRDLLPRLLAAGEPVRCHRSSEYIKDMGTPERLRRVEEDIADGRVARLSRRRPRRAIFFDRDGTLVLDPAPGYDPKQLTLLPGAATAVAAANRAGLLTVLVTNQPAIAKNFCDLAMVRTMHQRLEFLLGEEGAYLDAIRFCPHHPEMGFPGENPAYKKNCSCRKPAPGMILDATAELDVDLSGSWMVGDSPADIAAGKNAGARTALVLTGRGGKDHAGVAPDLTCDNVLLAVERILAKEKLSLAAEQTSFATSPTDKEFNSHRLP